MKQTPLLTLTLAGALLLGAGHLQAADDWVNAAAGKSGSSSGTSGTPTPDKAPDPNNSLPAGTAGTGAGGWLFGSDATAPAAQEGAPVSDNAATLLANMKLKDQFSKFWSTYARAYIPWDQDYVSLPGYNPLYPSSKGMTTEQVAEKMGKKVTLSTGLVSRATVIPLSLPEAQAAAMTLPTMEVGQYGYIHSFKVDKILSADEMIVSNVWLLDPDATLKEKNSLLDDAQRKARIIGDSNEAMRRNAANNSGNSSNNNNFGPNAASLMNSARSDINEQFNEREKTIGRQKSGSFSGPFKVKGYPTASIAEGQRWTGPGAQVGKSGHGMQIAVIRIVDLKPEKQTQASNRFGFKDPKNRLPEIVPAYFFRTGLSQEQFVTMLNKYGMTPDQFVELVVTEIKRENDTAKDRVFLALHEAQRKWSDQKKIEEEETRKTNEKNAKEAEKAAKDAERAARDAQRKSTR